MLHSSSSKPTLNKNSYFFGQVLIKLHRRFSYKQRKQIKICCLQKATGRYNEVQVTRQSGGQSDMVKYIYIRFNECDREVTIHRPNFWTLPSSVFIRGDLIASTREGPLNTH